MHSCNNTVAPGVTVHVQTVLLQQQHMLAVVFATPSLRAVDNALIKTFPLVHDALAKFFSICNLPLVVDPLLHDSPYQIVDGVRSGLLGGHKLGWMKSGVTSFSNSTVSRAL